MDWLHNSDETNLLTFLRADDKDELLVVINFSDHPLTGKVDLKNADGFVPVEISGVPGSEGGPLPTIHLNRFRMAHLSSPVYIVTFGGTVLPRIKTRHV